MQWSITKIITILLLLCGCFTLHAKNASAQTNQIEISERETQLYLMPAGKYTSADIQANGSMTRSQKFKDFISSHNPNPQSGDAICPISKTKANSHCSWVIGGKTYQFCCPSCIDEFITLAKKSPQEIKDPEYYIK